MKKTSRLAWLLPWLKPKKHTREQLIFITSETRSGSTWLSYMLGTHPQAAHLGEYYRPFLQRGHVSCRLCEGRGLSDCKILGNLSEIPISHAYGFALERYKSYGIHTLIDCSKDLAWLDQIILAGGGSNDGSLPIKVIHLIRDPRGWIASERRRVPMTIDEAIDRWQQHHRTTQQWIRAKGIPSICISYDQLCLEPERALRKLSKLIGAKQDFSQYEYWNKEHHGLGGNGAALNNLIHSPKATPTTGDDEFYQQKIHKIFYDLRWKSETDSNQLDILCRQPDIEQIMNKSGISLNKIDRLSQQLM